MILTDHQFTHVPLVVLVGPTAIGKTALSLQLAQEFNFEIISVDSMQVYRYMDIGTAKIKKEEMAGVPHHMLDVVDPDEPFNAGLFEKMALKAVQEIVSRGNRVLLTGGTGLYLRALLTGLSQKLPCFPALRKELEEEVASEGPCALHEQLRVIDRLSAERIHPNDTGRLVRAMEIYRGTGSSWSEHLERQQADNVLRFPNVLYIGLTCEREKLYKQIELRSQIMLQSGLQEEVQGLLERGYGAELQSMQSIGYRHMVHYLSGKWDHPTMLHTLFRDTRRYAKRQYTWFNASKEMNWLEKKDEEKAAKFIAQFLNKY